LIREERREMNGFSIFRCVSVVCIAAAISACTTCKPVYVSAAIPTPPSLARPLLETSKLTVTSSDGETARAYRVTIEQLIRYATSLEKIVETYDKLSRMDNNKNKE
jgi:hypothetical protein